MPVQNRRSKGAGSEKIEGPLYFSFARFSALLPPCAHAHAPCSLRLLFCVEKSRPCGQSMNCVRKLLNVLEHGFEKC